MSNCLFCKIIQGEIPSEKIYEDELCYAFQDIAPMAPVHALVIPKEHICSMNELNAQNSALAAHIFTVIPRIASDLGLENGYRVVSNCGESAGQTVFHLHFHLLGGERLGTFGV